jgi:hypothetical protein
VISPRTLRYGPIEPICFEDPRLLLAISLFVGLFKILIWGAYAEGKESKSSGILSHMGLLENFLDGAVSQILCYYMLASFIR